METRGLKRKWSDSEMDLAADLDMDPGAMDTSGDVTVSVKRTRLAQGNVLCITIRTPVNMGVVFTGRFLCWTLGDQLSAMPAMTTAAQPRTYAPAVRDWWHDPATHQIVLLDTDGFAWAVALDAGEAQMLDESFGDVTSRMPSLQRPSAVTLDAGGGLCIVARGGAVYRWAAGEFAPTLAVPSALSDYEAVSRIVPGVLIATLVPGMLVVRSLDTGDVREFPLPFGGRELRVAAWCATVSDVEGGVVVVDLARNSCTVAAQLATATPSAAVPGRLVGADATGNAWLSADGGATWHQGARAGVYVMDVWPLDSGEAVIVRSDDCTWHWLERIVVISYQ
jgi:hypothetical protein